MKRRGIAAVVLAFLVPGAGHLFLGKRSKAAVFFLTIGLLFAIGLFIQGKVYTYEPGAILNNFATLGSLGTGLLYLVAWKWGATGDILSMTFEYGTAFTLSAGLMNLLAILDAYDLAEREE